MTLKMKTQIRHSSEKIETTRNNALVKLNTESVKRIRDLSTKEAEIVYERIIAKLIDVAQPKK